MNVRRARPEDYTAIETLYQNAARTSTRLWWWEEHLGGETFVVIEQNGRLRGALFAWPDGSPVAWVRLAALDDTLDPGLWMRLSLPPVIAGLYRLHARTLAWLDYDGWAGPYLSSQGFERFTEVITLVKRHRLLPPPVSTEAALRPATRADVPATVAIDQAAFTPHWWHSTDSMFRKMAAVTHFLVAVRGGEVIGYVEGTANPPRAHINRLAVLPSCQNQGIGTMLLRGILTAFWRREVREVTLNTQSDNDRARQLYRRFGFQPMGKPTVAWGKRLSGG